MTTTAQPPARPVTTLGRFRGSWAAWQLALSLLMGLVTVCRHARAEERVPVQLQAQLVARLGTFDRNFQARAGGVANVLVVHRAKDLESTFEAAGLAKALADLHDIAGVPGHVEEIEFENGPSLAARCQARRISIVYFATGLEAEMPGVAAALSGVDVLTVGTSPRHAQSGAVVAFGLEEARPRIFVNLRQAKAQNVNFKAELLKLARLVD